MRRQEKIEVLVVDVEQIKEEKSKLHHERPMKEEYEEETRKEMGEETKMEKEMTEMEKVVEEKEKPQEGEMEKEETEPEVVDGMDGLYIRLVLRREGRTDLVWLYKTHKF